MNKIKEFIKKHKLYFIFLVIIILLLLCQTTIMGLYPIGNNTLVKQDLKTQYYPMLIEMYNRVHNGSSFIFSFNEGLGMPLYRNFFNYLSSPFNIIFILIKDHILAVHLIIYIKIIFIGLFMLMYLKNKFKTDNILLIIPALCYALCGWIEAYNINIMWLDGVMMLPLITLGIEKIINEKKYNLYIFSLAYIIITNYYIGYMVCIFSAIYFLFYNLYKIKTEGSIKYKLNELSRKFIHYSISSIIAVLISAIVLLPLLMNKASLDEKFSAPIDAYEYNIVDFLGGTLSNSYATILAAGPNVTKAPNIYTGIISILLIIPFLINKDISKKTKIIYSLLLLLFFAIMRLYYLDYIMNLFHIPVGFPFRYSFMYSLILSIIVSYELINIKNYKLKETLLSIISVSIPIILVLVFKTDKIDLSRTLLNIIYIIPIVICLLLNKFKLSKCILILIVGIELIISYTFSSRIYSVDEVTDYFNNDYINNVKKPNNNEFFRSEIYYTTINMPLINDYYGVGSSSSMNYSPLYYFAYQIGLETDYSANIKYTHGSYLANLFFGVRYINMPNENIENKNYLQLLYGIEDKKIKNLNNSNNFFKSSNDIVKELTNIDDLYFPNKYKKKDIVYEDDDFIYYKYYYPNNTYLKLSLSNIAYAETGESNYGMYIINNKYDSSDVRRSSIYYPAMIEVIDNEIIIGYFKDRIKEEYIISYQMDVKKADEIYEYLNRYPVTIDYFDEDYIEVSTDFDNDLSMMSSIPYDKGWHVYIDDIEVNTYPQYGTFLGFDISKGNHKIKLKYKIPYLKEGMIISISSILLIVIYDICKKYMKNKA